MRTGIRRPSPALVIAMIALFASLGGYATAATIVPLAKRALTADSAKKAAVAAAAKKALVAENAKKLGGRTIEQLTAAAEEAAEAAASSAAQAAALQPGPASTAAGLVIAKSKPWGQIPGESFRELGTFSCDPGQKIMGGGMSSDGAVLPFDSYPLNDTTWAYSALNIGGTANVSLWITCLK
jgi:hypothetical protein